MGIWKRYLFDGFGDLGTDPVAGEEGCFDRSGGGGEGSRSGNER